MDSLFCDCNWSLLTRFRGILDFGWQAVEYPHRRFQILLRSTMGPIDVYLVRFVALVVALRQVTYSCISCAECGAFKGLWSEVDECGQDCGRGKVQDNI